MNSAKSAETRAKISATKMGKTRNLEWHAIARGMKAAGVPIHKIAAYFGKGLSSVNRVLYPKVAESTRNRVRRLREQARGAALVVPAAVPDPHLPASSLPSRETAGGAQSSPASSLTVSRSSAPASRLK